MSGIIYIFCPYLHVCTAGLSISADILKTVSISEQRIDQKLVRFILFKNASHRNFINRSKTFWMSIFLFCLFVKCSPSPFNSQCPFCISVFFKESRMWFVSSQGSDENECSTPALPCKTLGKVMSRISGGTVIHILSNDMLINCWTNTTKSYIVELVHGNTSKTVCSKFALMRKCFFSNLNFLTPKNIQ